MAPWLRTHIAHVEDLSSTPSIYVGLLTTDYYSSSSEDLMPRLPLALVITCTNQTMCMITIDKNGICLNYN